MAGSVEDQANQVRAGLDGCVQVTRMAQAADLDLDILVRAAQELGKLAGNVVGSNQ